MKVSLQNKMPVLYLKGFIQRVISFKREKLQARVQYVGVTAPAAVLRNNGGCYSQKCTGHARAGNSCARGPGYCMHTQISFHTQLAICLCRRWFTIVSVVGNWGLLLAVRALGWI